DAFAANHSPVTFFEIGDALGPGRDGKRVRAKVILAVAIADGQRRSHARADDEVGMVAEQDREGESADQPRQYGRDGVLRGRAALDLARDEVADDLGVGLAFEPAPFGDQLVAQGFEVLDDAVVDECDWADDVGVRIADGGRTMRRPACMGDAGNAMERIFGKLTGEVVELPLGPPTLELAVVDGADARGIIAAILQPLEAVEQPLRDVGLTDDADNPAHGLCNSFERRTAGAMP